MLYILLGLSGKNIFIKLLKLLKNYCQYVEAYTGHLAIALCGNSPTVVVIVSFD